jgi:HK97 family phage portal protein
MNASMAGSLHTRTYTPGTILNRLGEAIVPRERLNNNGGSLWSSKTTSGVVVDEDNVMEIDAVLSCVRVLAESLASLPFELFSWDRIKDELQAAVDMVVYELVRWQANPEMTAYELRFWMMVDAIVRGFGAAQVLRNNKGEPVELWPLEASQLSACRTPDNRRLVYKYKLMATKSKAQREVLLEADEVLIVKGFAHGGLLGSSLTRLAKNAMGATKAVEDYASEFFANGVITTGTIEVPEELSDTAYGRLKADWKEQHTGKGNRHRAPILEGGAVFKSTALNHEESQLLETQKYKRSVIAGILRVPAHLINDLEKATFSNVEHLDLSFIKHSLRPWTTMWEQRCRMTMLAPKERKNFLFAHDFTDLGKGDFPSRMTAYNSAVSAGILSPNEVRRKERWNPYVGGDIYLVQGALRDITKPAPTTQPANPAAIPAAPAPKA